MNRQRGLAPILIVILIALAAGGYLIYTNYSNNRYKTVQSTPVPTSSSTPTSSDETANWKTYTYKNGEFSFKYPNNWYIKDNRELNEDTAPISFFQEGEAIKPSMGMTRGNEQLIVGIRTDQSFNEIEKQLNLGTPLTNLNGKRALRYTTGIYILLSPSDKRILSISRPQYPDKGELDQILSTFKFTQ